MAHLMAPQFGCGKASADGVAGWAGVNAKKVYVTNDDDYIYLGAELIASNWMSWGFIINTKVGGGSTDSWGKDITNTHTNLPDYSIRGNFNNGWTEINIWDGAAWTGNGVDIGVTEHGDNITGADIDGWIEVRVPRAIISELAGDIEFFVSGDQTSHGSFDSCPNDDNSTDWSGVDAHSDLTLYIPSSPTPVELTTFTANNVDGSVELNWETATEVNNYGLMLKLQTIMKTGMLLVLQKDMEIATLQRATVLLQQTVQNITD